MPNATTNKTLVEHKKRYRIGIIIAASSAVVFGFWPAATRGIYAEGGNFVFALLVSTWLRALAMGLFCWLTKRPLFRTSLDTRRSLVGGFFQALCLVTVYPALIFLPGPVVIIILFSHTLMLLFYLAWRGEIKLDALTVVSTLIALIGLSFVLDLWHHQSNRNLWGIVLAFVSALATVSRLYVYGHQTRERHPIVVGAESFLATAVLVSLLVVFKGPVAPKTLTGYGFTALGCISLTMGTFAMFYGISLLGSFRWSLFLKLEPIFTTLFSYLLLGEILKVQQYVGIAVVVVTLVLYQIVDQRRKFTEEIGV